MKCKDFEIYIHEYFRNPDFDWKLRQEIDLHYLECDRCFETYQVAKMMADKGLKLKSLQKLSELLIEDVNKQRRQKNFGNAIRSLRNALKIEPGNAILLEEYHILLKNSLCLEFNGKNIEFQWENNETVVFIEETGLLVISTYDQTFQKEIQADLMFSAMQFTFAYSDQSSKSIFEEKIGHFLIKGFKRRNKIKIEIHFIEN